VQKYLSQLYLFAVVSFAVVVVVVLAGQRTWAAKALEK